MLSSSSAASPRERRSSVGGGNLVSADARLVEAVLTLQRQRAELQETLEVEREAGVAAARELRAERRQVKALEEVRRRVRTCVRLATRLPTPSPLPRVCAWLCDFQDLLHSLVLARCPLSCFQSDLLTGFRLCVWGGV